MSAHSGWAEKSAVFFWTPWALEFNPESLVRVAKKMDCNAVFSLRAFQDFLVMGASVGYNRP